MLQPELIPVTPRPAASLLVVRIDADTPSVLMGLRGAGHRFMPNRLVFPGGAVDPEDHGAAVATPLAEHVLARLRANADAPLAAALGVAAARELEEESGLSLGHPPRLGGLDYLCRAVTLPTSPMRFDARFFAVDAAETVGTLAGSGELEGLRFYPMADALALDLAVVTRGVLGKLLGWLPLSAPDRAARRRSPVLLARIWQEE